LKELRRRRIKGFLRQPLSESKAKRVLAQLRVEANRVDAGQNLQLTPFCFAIEQALEREIRTLRSIKASRRMQRRG
jgi:hypothetical protein